MKEGGTPGRHEELPKLLVVTGYPPSTAFGGGIVLRDLLRGYPRGRLTVVTSDYETRNVVRRGHADGLLDVPHVLIRTWRLNVRGAHRVLRLLNVVKILVPTALGLAWRARRGATILAVPYGAEFGSELFVAAYLAHRLSRVPLVVYEMDEWRASLVQEGINGRISRTLEKLFHHRVLRAARKVWVMSDPMAVDLGVRFGVEAEALPSCVEVSEFDRGRQGERVDSDELRLLYTGSIYGPQAGAIRNVLEAIRATPDLRASLIVYTSQSPDEIARQGLIGPNLRVERSVSAEELPDVLAKADALLLPFSFDEQQRAVVSTSLPSKTAGYLASGVPVLVHAPPYATITRLACREGWAEIVDEPGTEGLAAALRSLASNEPLRKRLVANALRAARERYDLATRRPQFLASLQGKK